MLSGTSMGTAIPFGSVQNPVLMIDGFGYCQDDPVARQAWGQATAPPRTMSAWGTQELAQTSRPGDRQCPQALVTLEIADGAIQVTRKPLPSVLSTQEETLRIMVCKGQDLASKGAPMLRLALQSRPNRRPEGHHSCPSASHPDLWPLEGAFRSLLCLLASY